MLFRPWPHGWRARLALLLPAVVIAALVTVALARHARQREPESVSELLDRLRDAGIHWHVYCAMQGGGLEHGAYLCDRPRSWEELQFLGRWRDEAPRWRGVVLVDRHPPEPLDGNRGEGSVVVGGLSLFGDREMLKQILAALGR